MIKIFDMEGGLLKPTIHCWSIKWLKDIMDYPEWDYMKVYYYIHYMTCPDETLNPYRNYPEEEKRTIILQAINADIYTDDMRIETAISKLTDLYKTPATEAWAAAKAFLESFKRSIQETEVTWGGKDATGPALTAAMEKLPKLIQAYAATELKMNQELSARARGNQEMAFDLDELDKD